MSRQLYNMYYGLASPTLLHHFLFAIHPDIHLQLLFLHLHDDSVDSKSDGEREHKY